MATWRPLYVNRPAIRIAGAPFKTFAEAEEAWVEVIRSVAILNRDFQNACTPGYYNNEGGERSGGLNGQTYTPGINKFNDLLAEWRERGDLDGLQLHYP